MNALTIFTRCREAEDDVRRLKMRIQQRRDALTSITAPPPDPPPKSPASAAGPGSAEIHAIPIGRAEKKVSAGVNKYPSSPAVIQRSSASPVLVPGPANRRIARSARRSPRRSRF